MSRDDDNEEEIVEYALKVLVLGRQASGKTSIINRYTSNSFSSTYLPTLGVDFVLKIVRKDPKTSLRVQFWDLSGQSKFSDMTRPYFKSAHGALIVFDISNLDSFKEVELWKNGLDERLQYPVPVAICANKSDLPHRVSHEEIDALANKLGVRFLTSAATNTGINDACDYLYNTIYAGSNLEPRKNETVELGAAPANTRDCGC